MMTSILKIDISELAPELSTRPVGVRARDKLAILLSDYESVEIDFNNRSLTPSFADECIGRLAALIGLSEFKKRVKLTNVNSSTKPLIRHVILTRCSDLH